MPSYQSYRLPAQSSGYAYELPDDRYLGEPVAQPTPQDQYAPSFMGPAAQPGSLADVEGLTDAYYDTYGKLDSLAKSAWLKHKIDITAPDFSQPGGGVPFKTYQMLTANLMNVANRLGTKLKEDTQMRPLMATGQTVKRGDQYVPTQLLPEVENLMKVLNQDFYSETEADRAITRLKGPAIAQIKSRYDLNDPYIQDQLRIAEGLNSTYRTHPYFYQQREEDKTKARQMAAATKDIGLLKRVTAVKQGKLDPKNVRIEERGGRTYGVSDAWKDFNFDTITRDGRRIIAPVQELLIADDGKVQVVFAPDTETGEALMPQRIDDMNSADLTIRLQSANPRLGSGDRTLAAMEVLGLQDEGFGANEDAILADTADSLNANFEVVRGKIKNAERVRAEKQRVSEALDKGSLEIQTPAGKVTIEKNYRLLGPNSYKVKGLPLGDAQPTKEKLIELISNTGYFDQFGGASSSKTPEQLKAEEYIQKYSR